MNRQQRTGILLAGMVPSMAIGVYMLTATPSVHAQCGANQCQLNGPCSDIGGCVPSACDPSKNQKCLPGNVWTDCGCS